jgi:hypothetical protein
MLKRILVSLAAAGLSTFAQADDFVARNGRNTLRLTQEPCTVQAAIDSVRDEFASLHRQGVLLVPGQPPLLLCWVAVGDVVQTMDEEGNYAPVPLSAFKREDGI